MDRKTKEIENLSLDKALIDHSFISHYFVNPLVMTTAVK